MYVYLDNPSTSPPPRILVSPRTHPSAASENHHNSRELFSILSFLRRFSRQTDSDFALIKTNSIIVMKVTGSIATAVALLAPAQAFVVSSSSFVGAQQRPAAATTSRSQQVRNEMLPPSPWVTALLRGAVCKNLRCDHHQSAEQLPGCCAPVLLAASGVVCVFREGFRQGTSIVRMLTYVHVRVM